MTGADALLLAEGIERALVHATLSTVVLSNNEVKTFPNALALLFGCFSLHIRHKSSPPAKSMLKIPFLLVTIGHNWWGCGGDVVHQWGSDPPGAAWCPPQGRTEAGTEVLISRQHQKGSDPRISKA